MEDRAKWVQPPCGTTPGDPVQIAFRVKLKRVNSVDTKAGTAFVKFDINYVWTDSRLAGWPKGVELPPWLWGPLWHVANHNSDWQEVQSAFQLEDRQSGRLRRTMKYSGVVDNPMNLRDFPFDLDSIDIIFYSMCHWMTLNEEACGYDLNEKPYKFRLARGQWLVLLWDGTIHEWDLLGVSNQTSTDGPSQSTVVSCHVARKYPYYFWKVMLPLYLITFLSFSSFHFEVADLEPRVNTISTYILASFAMLYVVGDVLPKTDFLTKVDSAIVVTIFSLAFIGTSILLLNYIHNHVGPEEAEKWNLIIETSLISIDAVVNVMIFLPAWFQQRTARRQLASYRTTSGDNEAAVDNWPSGENAKATRAHQSPPPTVQPSAIYCSIGDLLEKQKIQ